MCGLISTTTSVNILGEGAAEKHPCAPCSIDSNQRRGTEHVLIMGVHEPVEITAMKPSFRERQELRNEYVKEVDRMLRCLQHAGVKATDDEAVLAWATYSDDLCASWLGLPKEDAALQEILVKYLPGAKSRVWRVTVVDAGDGSGDFIVPLPSELLALLGWAIGVELVIERADDGSLVLRRRI